MPSAQRISSQQPCCSPLTETIRLSAVNFTRQELAERVASLATQGVFVGTSSWKYPGLCGTLYDRSRYEYRGKFVETRFKRDCLAKWAGVFKAVCVDAAFHVQAAQGWCEFHAFLKANQNSRQQRSFLIAQGSAGRS